LSESPDSQAPPPETTGARQGRAALSKDLSDFLLELSIGVHRHAMYPPGHPSLAPAVEGIFRRLAPLLDRRGVLNIGVARKQLVIEGVATEEKHPVLSELARRLHDLQLGAVSFESGVAGDEIIGLLEVLSMEIRPEDTPIGLLPADELPSWPHVRVHPLGYDRLSIRDAEGETVQHDRATQLWLGLAQAALAGQDLPEAHAADPTVVARSITEHKREAAYDQVIVGYMLQLAHELKAEKGMEAERVRTRMANLVREMDEDTLARLVELGGDHDARRRFVLDANQSLAVDAVMKVLNAAASASGQNVSTSMTRLLSKLATHAGDGGGRLRTQASAALRDNVEKLLDDWALVDPNPDQYTRVLDAISRAAPIFQAREARADITESEDDDIPGPLRLVQMALEVGAWGTTVEAAMLDLVSLGYAGDVLAMAQAARGQNEVADRLVAEMTATPHVRRYLLGADVEEVALQAVADQRGSKAIPLFLDALADSESRSVRRKVFNQVAKMGPEVGEAVLERLPAEDRWYVIRNWLALLRFYPDLTLDLDVMHYLQHRDARVRREALPLALARKELRPRALAAALADPDERNCRVALAQLKPPIPETLLPTLLKRVVLGTARPAGLRVMGAQALAGSRTPLVRDSLLGLVTTGKSLLGKVKLTEKDPVALAALSVLAVDWAHDPRVAEVLGAARKTRDPQILEALEGKPA
jgi:hypothetical protein